METAANISAGEHSGSVEATTTVLQLLDRWTYKLRRYRWVMPLVFPLLGALQYLNPVHQYQQSFIEHVLEWQLVLVYILSAFASWFIYRSDQLSDLRMRELLLYREILEKIPTDIAVFDAEHRYVYLNPTAIANPQLREWIIGKNDLEYFEYRGYDQKVAEKRHAKFLSAYRNHRSEHWVDSLFSNDKGMRHVQRTFTPVFSTNGQLEYMFGYGADVTELMTLKTRDADLHANMRYAMRIQSLLLPSPTIMEHNMAPTMVIWKPKDVVSGDFYWHRQVDGCSYVALGDCTGHGVAGALLTVLCIDTLNRCIDEFGQRTPADILNLCQELLCNSFSITEGAMEDGMDICLCCIQDGQLHFSAANRPLYVQRQGELMIYRPDRVSIGRRKEGHQFVDRHLQLQPNDRLMMYTDGVTDQFGGDHDRKFGKVRLHEMLQKMQHMPLKQMYDTIYEGCEIWKGNREQVDDKTFMVIDFTEGCAALRKSTTATDSTIVA